MWNCCFVVLKAGDFMSVAVPLPLEDEMPESEKSLIETNHKPNQNQKRWKHFDYGNDETEIDMFFCGLVQKILRKMDERGLTASALSSLSGVTSSNLSLYFNYKRRPTLTTLYYIAHALDVPLVELLPDSYNNNRKTNGDRFEELTSDLSEYSVNYLLEIVAGFIRVQKHKK